MNSIGPEIQHNIQWLWATTKTKALLSMVF